VLVADTDAGRVDAFNKDGGELGTLISGLDHPTGLAIDHAGNIYVAEYNFPAISSSSTAEAGCLAHMEAHSMCSIVLRLEAMVLFG
jgi:DNA-binding beta-propeller fold protein YncE